MKYCSIDECFRPTLARGYCERHYRQHMRGVTPRSDQQRPFNQEAQYKAHYYVSRQIKLGNLKRPSVCEDCQTPCKTDAHHYKGYAEEHWLTVVFLCRKCHKNAHMLIDATPL